MKAFTLSDKMVLKAIEIMKKNPLLCLCFQCKKQNDEIFDISENETISKNS